MHGMHESRIINKRHTQNKAPRGTARFERHTNEIGDESEGQLFEPEA